MRQCVASRPRGWQLGANRMGEDTEEEDSPDLDESGKSEQLQSQQWNCTKVSTHENKEVVLQRKLCKKGVYQ